MIPGGRRFTDAPRDTAFLQDVVVLAVVMLFGAPSLVPDRFRPWLRWILSSGPGRRYTDDALEPRG